MLQLLRNTLVQQLAAHKHSTLESTMAVASALIDTSVALLLNKDKKEARKLRISEIQREIDYVQQELQSLARSHLLSSITLFKEGLLYLNKLQSTSGGDQAKTTYSFAQAKDKQVVGSAAYFKNLKLTNLDETETRALSAAKRDFEEARIKAIEAFNNEALDPQDRIQAMVIRVAATMLESVDHPEDVLAVCISCLKELHSLPKVKESFSLEINRWFGYDFNKKYRRQIISSVCRINHAVRSAAVMIAKKGELLTFPSIDKENALDRLDPLHDHRVAASLGKVEMEHYSLTPLVLGQEDEKDKKPKIPQGIATNSHGHFIVGDEWDADAKIFDADGNFHYALCDFPIDDKSAVVTVLDVATDGFDNVYVLVELQGKSLGVERYKMIKFDQEGNTKGDFFLRKETKEVLRITVNVHNEILVLCQSATCTSEEQIKSVVDVYKCEGHFNHSFGEETLQSPQDFCTTSDGRVIVLDRDDQRPMSALVFGPNEEFIEILQLDLVENAEKPCTRLRSSIASLKGGNHLVIAIPSESSQDEPVRILRYDADRNDFLPSILIPMEVKGPVSTRGIAVTPAGRIAVGLLDKAGGQNRVLVV